VSDGTVSGVSASAGFTYDNSLLQLTGSDFMITSSVSNGLYTSNFTLNTVTFDVIENDLIGSGSNLIVTIPFGYAYTAHMEYMVRSNSNVRTGDFYAPWDGSITPVHYDVCTVDIGDTSDVYFTANYSGSNTVIVLETPTSGWQLKGLLKIF